MQKAVAPSAAARAADSAQRLKAIGLISTAVILFTGLDTAAKYASTRAGIPLLQVVWLRFLTQLLLMIAFLGLIRVPALFRTRKLGHQLMRSCVLAGSTLFNFGALLYLRLDQTATIGYLMPLMVALLAGPVLGEWVGWRRMAAIAVGFLGVLVVLRPGFAAVHPAFALALCGTMCYALYSLSTRHLAAYDPTDVTLFYGLLVPVIALVPIAAYVWIWPPDALTWGLLFVTGACGGLGHYLLIKAHSLAPASTLAPFVYMSLIGVVAFGYVVFSDLPDIYTMAGSAIIIGSGLYLIHRERVVKGERGPAVAAPPAPERPEPRLTGPHS